VEHLVLLGFRKISEARQAVHPWVMNRLGLRHVHHGEPLSHLGTMRTLSGSQHRFDRGAGGFGSGQIHHPQLWGNQRQAFNNGE
jgi:hypothetical protein